MQKSTGKSISKMDVKLEWRNEVDVKKSYLQYLQQGGK